MPDAIAWTPDELSDRARIESEWPALVDRAQDAQVRFQRLWDKPRHRAEADDLEALHRAVEALEGVVGRK